MGAWGRVKRKPPALGGTSFELDGVGQFAFGFAGGVHFPLVEVHFAGRAVEDVEIAFELNAGDFGDAGAFVEFPDDFFVVLGVTGDGVAGVAFGVAVLELTLASFYIDGEMRHTERY